MARMIQACDVTEVDIDGRAFWVRPVSPGVLKSMSVLQTALAESLDKPSPWTVGFFSGDLDLSTNLWTIIAGISGLDD